MKPNANAVTKGLQKLTESELIINTLMMKDKILKSDIKGYTEEQLDLLGKVITEKLSLVKGVAHDQLIEKVNDLLQPDIKNQLWEYNHSKINYSISKLMSETGRMPSKHDIAFESGLSRQTVNKHLKEYSEHPLYSEQLQQFKFMADKVLAGVFVAAKGGDTKAARLYFDMIGMGKQPGTNSTSIQNQNNYIQINGQVLSQDSIMKLSVEQRNQIEGILNLLPPEI